MHVVDVETVKRKIYSRLQLCRILFVCNDYEEWMKDLKILLVYRYVYNLLSRIPRFVEVGFPSATASLGTSIGR